MMCKFCKGRLELYQETIETKMYINTRNKARAIYIESNGCPPAAICGLKDIPIRASFIINYCPNCGRKLSESNMEE